MNDISLSAHCPECGEPIQPSWRICPACETRLQAPVCPICKMAVRDTWRRCPECEAVLRCPECNLRFPVGRSSCPACDGRTAMENAPTLYTDPVCGMEFVPVAGGTFHMGDTLGEGLGTEKPVHEVALDDFFMARVPVTQSRWCLLMKENPSSLKASENPVEQVSWHQACEFAHRLTAAAGGKVTFHLPTEAQWEYAARSGGRDELYAGGADIGAVAWYEANSGGRSHPVGQKKPNALGLCDMSGNVWEWCRDTFHEDAYGRHAGRNPVITEPGPYRVIRGGGWNLDAWSARCARRFSLRSDDCGPALGVRLVMMPG